MNLISAAPTLQNLRSGLKKTQGSRANCPRSSVEAGQKSKKWKKRDKTIFFSPKIGACFHQLLTARTKNCCRLRSVYAHDQQKDLNSAEMDILKKSCSLTIVETENRMSADVWRDHKVRQRIGKILELKSSTNTPAVLSLGKLCDEHGYSYEWINVEEPHLTWNAIRIQCNTENFVCGSWLVIEFFFPIVFFTINDSIKTRDWSSNIFLNLFYFTNHNSVKRQWYSRTGRLELDWIPASICDKFTCSTKWTGRPVDQANQKSKTKSKTKSPRTERSVLVPRYRNDCKIQRESFGR